jgi:general secretion pathway protein K
MSDLTAQLPALAAWAAPLSALAVILPEATTINVNTAPKPVLAALMRGLNDGQVERFIYLRSRAPWRDLNAIAAAFPEASLVIDSAQAGVNSSYFIITAGVRLVTSASSDFSKATEVGMTTTVRRYPQENRIAIVRREFRPVFH